MAAEHRRMRRLRKNTPNKGASFFVTAPGAFSSEERDASRDQGRFDLGTLYQTQLRNDRYCMIVDFANGRVLFSNALCDELFASMCPLQHRDIAGFIHPDDRLKFTASIMYLGLGKHRAMEPQEVRIMSSTGLKRVVVTAEQLVGCWWWVDFDHLENAALDSTRASNAIGSIATDTVAATSDPAATDVGQGTSMAATANDIAGASGSCVPTSVSGAGSPIAGDDNTGPTAASAALVRLGASTEPATFL